MTSPIVLPKKSIALCYALRLRVTACSSSVWMTSQKLLTRHCSLRPQLIIPARYAKHAGQYGTKKLREAFHKVKNQFRDAGISKILPPLTLHALRISCSVQDAEHHRSETNITGYSYGLATTVARLRIRKAATSGASPVVRYRTTRPIYQASYPDVNSSLQSRMKS